jgi:hypothetical protein
VNDLILTLGDFAMTVRLVKRKQLLARDEKRPQPPSPTQLTLTTQGWIEEFRAQKARDQQTLSGLLKRG